MITVKKNFSLQEFEASLQPSALLNQDIVLPNKITGDAVGGLASVIQLIITWSRETPNNTLRVYGEGIHDSTFVDFALTPFGLVALNMARSVASTSGQTISRKEALELSSPLVDAMQAGNLVELAKRGMIPVFCIDNSKRSKRPELLFQPGTDKIQDKRSLTNLVGACVDILIPKNNRRTISRDFLKSAASLLFEALDNTQRYALKDHIGDRLARSTRGIIIAYRNIETSKLPHMATGSIPLAAYFSGWKPEHPLVRQAGFVELSIFDSGPGLAQTWLNYTRRLTAEVRNAGVSLEDEYQAVLRCLEKGGTVRDFSTDGNGLFRIFRVVKYYGGFIRIRTGRLSLIKTFCPQELEDELVQSDLQMSDLYSGSPPNEFHPWVYGTSITVMLPINMSRDV